MAEAYALFDVVDSPTSKSGKRITVTTPQSVVRIRDKDELKAQLKHYQKPFLGDTTPDTPFARKNYVEKIRPALRYYCNKLGVAIPAWLKSDAIYLDMPDHEKINLFGTANLKVREFQPVKSPEGSVNRGE